jgi:hypothetical protein
MNKQDLAWLIVDRKGILPHLIFRYTLLQDRAGQIG